MYELKTLPAAALLEYLNCLGNHEVIYCDRTGETWTALIRISKMGRPKKSEPIEIPNIPTEDSYAPNRSLNAPLGFPRHDED